MENVFTMKVIYFALLGFFVFCLQTYLVAQIDSPYPLHSVEYHTWKRSQPITIDEWNDLLRSKTDKAEPTGTMRLKGSRFDYWSTIPPEWIYFDSTICLYDSQNGLHTQSLSKGYDAISASWFNSTRENRSYTVQGFLSQLLYETWTGTAFENSNKNNYTNDSYGNITEDIASGWNLTFWEPYFRNTNTYTSFHAVEEYVDYYWDSGTSSWASNSKMLYSYTPSEWLSGGLSQYWNVSDWENNQKFEIMHNANGDEVSYRSYYWDTFSSDWMPSYRDTTIFTATGSENTTYFWDGISSWEPSIRTIATINSGIVSEYVYHYWDNISSVWIPYQKYMFTYDVNDNRIVEEMQVWNTLNTIWENSNRTTIQYNNNNYQIFYINELWDDVTTSYTNENQHYFWYEDDPFISVHEWTDVSIGLYPNPAKDYTVLSVHSQNDEILHLHIYDMSGQIAYQQELSLSAGQHQIPIYMFGMKPGYYIISIRSKYGAKNLPLLCSE